MLTRPDEGSDIPTQIFQRVLLERERVPARELAREPELVPERVLAREPELVPARVLVPGLALGLELAPHS